MGMISQPPSSSVGEHAWSILMGVVIKAETIPANSRRTFNMASHSCITGRASMLVTSRTPGRKVMVEHAAYWNSRGAGIETIGGSGWYGLRYCKEMTTILWAC